MRVKNKKNGVKQLKNSIIEVVKMFTDKVNNAEKDGIIILILKLIGF